MVMAVGVLYGYSVGAMKLLRVILIMIVGVFGSLVIQTFKHMQRSKAEVSTISDGGRLLGHLKMKHNAMFCLKV